MQKYNPNFDPKLESLAGSYARNQTENILRQNRSVKKSHRRYFNRVLFIQRVQKLYSVFCRSNDFIIFIKFTSSTDRELLLAEIKKHTPIASQDWFIKLDRSVWADLAAVNKELEFISKHLFYLSPNAMFYFKNSDDFSKVLRLLLKLEKDEKFLSSVLLIRDCNIFYDFSASTYSDYLRSFYSAAQSKPEILLKIADMVNYSNSLVLNSLDSSDLISKLEENARTTLPLDLNYNLLNFLKT